MLKPLTEKEPRTVTLPSGKVARIREGRGRDLMIAQRTVKPSDGPTAVVFALISQLVQLDGEMVVYEDLLDSMTLADVLVLQGEVMGDVNALPQPPPSQA